MSRSYKKNPYVSWACKGRGSMKKWKKQCNSSVREKLKDFDLSLDLGKIKRLIERWSAPDDGKIFRDEPKSYRK